MATFIVRHAILAASSFSFLSRCFFCFVFSFVRVCIKYLMKRKKKEKPVRLILFIDPDIVSSWWNLLFLNRDDFHRKNERIHPISLVGIIEKKGRKTGNWEFNYLFFSPLYSVQDFSFVLPFFSLAFFIPAAAKVHHTLRLRLLYNIHTHTQLFKSFKTQSKRKKDSRFLLIR